MSPTLHQIPEHRPPERRLGEPTDDAVSSPTVDDEASPTDDAPGETVAATEAGDAGTTVAGDGTPEASAEIPDSPVGERLIWVLDHLNQGATEFTPEVIEENFTSEFLTAFLADQFSATLQEFAAANAPLTFVDFMSPPTDTMALAVVTTAPAMRFW